jgi:hypothetical protein
VPEAAERLGVTRLTVYRWVRGTRRTPNGAKLHTVIRDTRTRYAFIPEAVVIQLARASRRARRPTARESVWARSSRRLKIGAELRDHADRHAERLRHVLGARERLAGEHGEHGGGST